MAQIMTVNGPIAPEELGFTSMHEHTLHNCRFMRDRFEALIPHDAPVRADDPVCLETLGDLRHAVILSLDNIAMTDEMVLADALDQYHALGGKAVVDMSTTGFRGDPEAIARISEASDVHIVASTGLYAFDAWPEPCKTMDVDALAAFMADEIQNGLDKTAVRPGQIKTAIEADFSEPEVNALKAGARTALETGMALTVHQGMMLAPEDGLRIADIVSATGLSLERVVIAHNDAKVACREIRRLILEPEARKVNLETAKALLDRGANLSFDCFGHFWDSEPLGNTHVMDWQRVAMLVELIQAGYGDQLVIGTDTFLKLLLKQFGGEAFCRLLTFVAPTLAAVGIGDETIDKITTHNPARILAF